MDNIIETPCISICRMDETGTCIGCGRTKEQIAKWSRMTNYQRRQIMDDLKKSEKK